MANGRGMHSIQTMPAWRWHTLALASPDPKNEWHSDGVIQPAIVHQPVLDNVQLQHAHIQHLAGYNSCNPEQLCTTASAGCDKPINFSRKVK